MFLFHVQGFVGFTLRDVVRTTKISINLLRGTGENRLRLVELGLRGLGTSHVLLHSA